MGRVCIWSVHGKLREKLLRYILQCVRYMMLVDNFVVSCLRIDVFRRIEGPLSTAFFYSLVGIVTAPELDNNAPLAVGFLGNRVVVHVYIIIFVESQST